MLKYFQSIINRFKNRNKVRHIPGNIYVVDAGYYGGDYIVLIKSDYVSMSFLNLGNMSIQTIDMDTFLRGFDYSVVRYLEKLPKYVFKVCKTQYEQINNGTYGPSKTNKNNEPYKWSTGNP
jgi:hypothetical protein